MANKLSTLGPFARRYACPPYRQCRYGQRDSTKIKGCNPQKKNLRAAAVSNSASTPSMLATRRAQHASSEAGIIKLKTFSKAARP
jgi:hypothetical protein